MTTWRYRCPEGHTSWIQRSNSIQACQEPKSEYYCESCKAAGDDPHFEELVDLKHQEL